MPIVLLLLALSLAVVPMGTASSRRKSAAGACRPGHRRVVAVDTKAQVYVHVERSSLTEVYDGCAYGHKPYLLGSVSEEIGQGGTEMFTLNGTTVAYLLAEIGKYTPASSAGWTIFVRDLRTGRIMHKVPTGTPAPAPKEQWTDGIGPARAIVVKTDGAVAWIAEDYQKEEGISTSLYQVHVLDRSGERVVAAGSGIAPRSLALAGSTVYWTQDGSAASATLR